MTHQTLARWGGFLRKRQSSSWRSLTNLTIPRSLPSPPHPAVSWYPGLGEDAGQATAGLVPVGREVASLLSLFEK